MHSIWYSRRWVLIECVMLVQRREMEGPMECRPDMGTCGLEGGDEDDDVRAWASPHLRDHLRFAWTKKGRFLRDPRACASGALRGTFCKPAHLVMRLYSATFLSSTFTVIFCMLQQRVAVQVNSCEFRRDLGSDAIAAECKRCRAGATTRVRSERGQKERARAAGRS